MINNTQEIITISECRKLRKIMTILTSVPVLTKKEYLQFIKVAEAILIRIDNEEK